MSSISIDCNGDEKSVTLGVGRRPSEQGSGFPQERHRKREYFKVQDAHSNAADLGS